MAAAPEVPVWRPASPLPAAMAAAAAVAVLFAVALAAALAAAAPAAAAALFAASFALFNAAALAAALDAAASAAAALRAAAEFAAGVGAAFAGGGESLPVAGNCRPSPPSWLLPGLGLRSDLAPTWLSAAAKSWPLPAGFTESAAAPPPIWVRSGVFGVSETTGVAFIPKGVSN